MASITLENVSVDYPVFLGSRELSFKNKIFKQVVGGFLYSDSSNHQYIKALNNVSVILKQGDRVGLTGLNGSGKSTLLKIFSGSLEPTAGKVSRNGNITSMIEFSMGLDGELTGIENIILRAGLKNMTKIETEKYIEDVIKFSELDNFKNIQLCQYSTGMQMRLAFSMALFHFTDILIIDEIIFVGDKDFGKKIKNKLHEFIEKNIILIIASHNQELLKLYCNKFINLEKGKLSSIT
jgi:lipopolysaccharide transport system ATP-binding protein